LKNIGNKTIENITLNKDVNSILKYCTCSDTNVNNDIVNTNKPDQTNANGNGNANSNVNANLNQQFINKSKDFSHLFILMRKATKLFSSFDNKVKLFTDKINTEK